MLLCPSDARKLFLKSSGGHQKAAVPAFSCQAEPPKTACYDSPVFSSLSPSPPFKHGYLRVLTRNVCFCEPTLPLLFAWGPHARPDFPSLRRLTSKSFWKGGARGGRTFFQKGFPPRKLFHQNKKIPGWYRGRSKSHAGREIFRSAPWRPTEGKSIKKDPLALRAARGSRTIFGSGLLSHMTLCSIIGDGELTVRVRNGVGCTLSSRATKEIW